MKTSTTDAAVLPGEASGSMTTPPVKVGEQVIINCLHLLVCDWNTYQGGIPAVTFHCGACGTVHTAVALNYHAPYPALWTELTPSQRYASISSAPVYVQSHTQLGEQIVTGLMQNMYLNW
jgi:hypothetical protein